MGIQGGAKLQHPCMVIICVGDDLYQPNITTNTLVQSYNQDLRL